MTFNTDAGKFLLRFTIGGLMLFHGYHKLVEGHDFIKSSLVEKGLPEILWIGVPLSEVIAPLCLIAGVFTRISSALIAFTMLMTIYLALGSNAFGLNKVGALNGEVNLFYFFTSIVIILIGPGRYSLYKGRNKWMI